MLLLTSFTSDGNHMPLERGYVSVAAYTNTLLRGATWHALANSFVFAAGSTPKTRTPTSLKPLNKTPTLLPISTVKSLGPSFSRSATDFANWKKCFCPAFVVDDS